jgi:hypothetical protein
LDGCIVEGGREDEHDEIGSDEGQVDAASPVGRAEAATTSGLAGLPAREQ